MTLVIHAGPGSYEAPKADTSKLIDKGPFFDRFGALKLPILMSNDATIKAIIADINNRHWIDLSLAEVTTSIAYIGSVFPELTAELQTEILTKEVSSDENLVLRKLYFN